MQDFVLADERVNPPSKLYRWCTNFFLEVCFRYDLKCARWEYGQAKEGKAWLLAVKWMDQVEKLEDLLKRLGVDPRKEPEDLTKSLEVWLMVSVLIMVLITAFVYMGYRSEITEIVRMRM